MNRILSFLVLVVLASFAQAQSSTRLLRESMERREKTVAVLVQSMAMSMNPSDRVIVKLELDGTGQWKRTILQPLRMQGNVSLYDGKTLHMVVPNQKLVLKQGMPSQDSAALRMGLIEKNYRLKTAGTATVAGRSTYVVKAYSKVDQVPHRMIYLDKATKYILRIKSFDSNGNEETLLDTLAAEFPTRLPAQAMELSVPEGYRTANAPGFQRIASIEDVAKKISFNPHRPAQFPMGLAVEHVDLLNTRGIDVIAIRLTDGFIDLTAYQWDSKRSPQFFMAGEKAVRGERNGVYFMFVGDLPTTVLSKILEAFIKVLVSP